MSLAVDGQVSTLLGTILPLGLLAAGAVLAPAATSSAVSTAFSASARSRAPCGSGCSWPWAPSRLYGTQPLGRARLGDGAPQYSMVGWIAVLYTLLAGGGVFWVAAEPLFHFQTVPPHFEAPATRDAAILALAQALHWGFLAWSMVGLVPSFWSPITASTAFRCGPGAPRAHLQTRSGRARCGGRYRVDHRRDRRNRWPDRLSGAAARQQPACCWASPIPMARSGRAGCTRRPLHRIGASGLDRGIAWLSRGNVVGALALGIGVFLVGPTAFLLDVGPASLVAAIQYLPTMALTSADPAWSAWWTVFFWGWFLCFAPMMSVFVARISRGRTVRELVLAVSILAPLVTHLWFIVLGGTALGLEVATPGRITGPLTDGGMAAAMLAVLQALPGDVLLVPLFIGLVFCFLATTGDSVAYAISVVISGRPSPRSACGWAGPWAWACWRPPCWVWARPVSTPCSSASWSPRSPSPR